MAYDKIIPIRSRLDHCMGYVLNPKKTELAQVLSYMDDHGKNTVSKQHLAVAINCNLETALDDMLQTKARWGKTGGVLGYHLIHSFAPGEVTPEQAHEIGVEFANRLLVEQYEGFTQKLAFIFIFLLNEMSASIFYFIFYWRIVAL